MAPFKSEAHKNKIAELEKAGKIKPGTSKKWAEETTEKLPERLSPKKPKSIADLKNISKRFGVK